MTETNDWRSDPENLDRKIEEKNAECNKLNSELRNLRTEEQTLTSEVGDLKEQKTTIDNYVSENSPLKKILEGKITELEIEKTALDNNIAESKANVVTLEENSSDLKEETETKKTHLEEFIKKSDLYSRDLEGIGKDNTRKTKFYSRLGIFFILFPVALVFIWGYTLLTWDFSTYLPSSLLESPVYVFWLMVIAKGVTSALLILLVYIFISVGKASLAENSRAAEKMSSIMLIDFFSNRLDRSGSEAPTLETMTVILKNQSEMLSQHLPKIIEQKESAFERDTSNKTVSQITKLLKSFKDTM
jgi:hypothetical protein